ncbi:MAG: clostripain-related cysteine peptidase, partial [Salinispira sp.]
MHLRRKIILLILVFPLLTCTPPNATEKSRTVLVYMLADNNLNSYGWSDIDDMEAGLAGMSENSADSLLVYIDGASHSNPSHPVLLNVEADNSPGISSSVVYAWPEWNSADPDTMKTVIEHVASRYPADSYGLVLWSHGTAWLPPDFISRLYGKSETGSNADEMQQNIPVKTFGLDNGDEMPIIELSRALPVYFEFIAFDACYMASVEVAYQLRESTRYFLASPSEILADGFPYRELLPQLFGNRNSLIRAGREFFSHYNNQSGVLRSASIAFIDTFMLEDLAAAMKPLLTSAQNLPESELQKIQQYERSASGYLYDLYDITRVVPES